MLNLANDLIQLNQKLLSSLVSSQTGNWWFVWSSKKWILNSTRSVRASGSRTCIIVYTKLTMIPFASIGPIFYPFVLRDEKDDIIEKDDLLNPDSFLSGGKRMLNLFTVNPVQEQCSLYKFSFSVLLSNMFVFRWTWHINCVSTSEEAYTRVEAYASNWYTKSLHSQVYTKATFFSGKQTELMLYSQCITSGKQDKYC